MGVDIVEVDEEDAGRVADLARIIWNEAYAGIISPEQIGYMLRMFQSQDAVRKGMADGDRYFVALLDGEDAGYLCVADRGDSVFLSKLYVRSEHRRKGIATMMLDAVRGMAGGLRIVLTVNRGNKDAVAFYRAAGFRTVGDSVKDIGGGFVMDDHVMELGT